MFVPSSINESTIIAAQDNNILVSNKNYSKYATNDELGSSNKT